MNSFTQNTSVDLKMALVTGNNGKPFEKAQIKFWRSSRFFSHVSIQFTITVQFQIRLSFRCIKQSSNHGHWYTFVWVLTGLSSMSINYDRFPSDILSAPLTTKVSTWSKLIYKVNVFSSWLAFGSSSDHGHVWPDVVWSGFSHGHNTILIVIMVFLYLLVLGLRDW